MRVRFPLLPIILFAFVSGLTALAATAQEFNLYVTGSNSNGQLGTGDTTEINTYTPITIDGGKRVAQVAAGESHSMIVTGDGVLYVTGYNSHGELGKGDTTEINTYTPITIDGGKIVVQVAAGRDHSMIVTGDGELYVTGSNSSGALGTGDTTNRNTYTPITIDGGKRVAQVSAGGYHSMIVTGDGELYVTGLNDYGELGTGDTTEINTYTPITIDGGKRVAQVSAGDFHSMIVTEDGALYVTGDNRYGALGTGDNAEINTYTRITIDGGKRVAQVSAGGYYSMIVTGDGELYVTGSNRYGQLGTGDNAYRNTFTPITIEEGKRVAQVSAGGYHSMIVTGDDGFYVTGANRYGRLGTGDITDRNTYTRITIDEGKQVAQVFAGYHHSMVVLQDPVIEGRTYHLYANTESYRYYPLNEEGMLSEPFEYEVIGSLPDGLVIRDGMLQGVVAQTGIYSFTIVLTSGLDQLTLSYTIQAVEPTLQPIFTGVYLNGVFSTTTIVEGSTHTTPAVTELYNATVAVNTPLMMSFIWDFIKDPLVYCIVGGDFPDGLVLNGNTGEITGTPTTLGNYIFVVSVMDWRGRAFQWIRLVVE